MSGLVHKDPQSISRKISVAPMMDWVNTWRVTVVTQILFNQVQRRIRYGGDEAFTVRSIIQDRVIA